MRPAACALLALLAAGCLDAAPDPVPFDFVGDCAEGDAPVFLATISGGGFVPQDHVPHLVEVTHDGRLRSLSAHTRAGNGSIVEAEPGALGNLTPERARDMVAHRNLSLEGRDLVVTRGIDAPLSQTEFDRLCALVGEAFPALKARYVEGSDQCADQGSTTWDISMRQGEKTVFVDDCATDAGDFRPLQEALRQLEEARAPSPGA